MATHYEYTTLERGKGGGGWLWLGCHGDWYVQYMYYWNVRVCCGCTELSVLQVRGRGEEERERGREGERERKRGREGERKRGRERGREGEGGRERGREGEGGREGESERETEGGREGEGAGGQCMEPALPLWEDREEWVAVYTGTDGCQPTLTGLLLEQLG